MCISKRSVIGICGRTCVGKTTVAKMIAEALGWAHRNCGKEVVEAAGRCGVAVAGLALGEHLRIDAETVGYARRSEVRMVVEGRYLRYVLAGLTAVTLVELTCGRTERIRRCVQRSGHREPERAIEESDRRDLELTSKLYSIEPGEAAYSFDTTKLDPAAVRTAILGALGVRVR